MNRAIIKLMYAHVERMKFMCDYCDVTFNIEIKNVKVLFTDGNGD